MSTVINRNLILNTCFMRHSQKCFVKLRPVSLILGFFAWLPFAVFANPDLQARFEKSLKAVKPISNVEIVWQEALWSDDPHVLEFLHVKEFSRILQYSLVTSGAKFRAECTQITGTLTNLGGLKSVYDGSLYVTWNSGRRMSKKTDSRRFTNGSEGVCNPFVAPFIFLTKNSDDCLSCLLRPSDLISNEFAKGLILPTPRQSDGLLELFMPGQKTQNQPTTWRVVLDEAGDEFTPKTVTFIVPGERREDTQRFLEYTNLGAYRFPSRIAWTSTSYPPTSPPTVLSTGLVTVVSSLIPDQIPDSAFKLDEEEKSAAVVWDWNQENFTKSLYENSKSKASVQPRPNIYDEPADGSKQIADALDIARSGHKHVLLQFGANWCGPCHNLHQFFETNKNVAEALERDYVVVMIDVNKGHNKDIDTKYGHPTRFGLPAIVVLDSDGKQLTTLDTGKLVEGDHHSPEKVMAFLKEWTPKK